MTNFDGDSLINIALRTVGCRTILTMESWYLSEKKKQPRGLRDCFY